jgi:hypothetical protein
MPPCDASPRSGRLKSTFVRPVVRLVGGDTAFVRPVAGQSGVTSYGGFAAVLVCENFFWRYANPLFTMTYGNNAWWS